MAWWQVCVIPASHLCFLFGPISGHRIGQQIFKLFESNRIAQFFLSISPWCTAPMIQMQQYLPGELDIGLFLTMFPCSKFQMTRLRNKLIIAFLTSAYEEVCSRVRYEYASWALPTRKDCSILICLSSGHWWDLAILSNCTKKVSQYFSENFGIKRKLRVASDGGGHCG